MLQRHPISRPWSGESKSRDGAAAFHSLDTVEWLRADFDRVPPHGTCCTNDAHFCVLPSDIKNFFCLLPSASVDCSPSAFLQYVRRNFRNKSVDCPKTLTVLHVATRSEAGCRFPNQSRQRREPTPPGLRRPNQSKTLAFLRSAPTAGTSSSRNSPPTTGTSAQTRIRGRQPQSKASPIQIRANTRWRRKNGVPGDMYPTSVRADSILSARERTRPPKILRESR